MADTDLEGSAAEQLPPEHWATDAALVDGGTVHLRPIGPADADGLVEFHSQLSPETTYLRFFSPHPRLSAAEVHRFTHVDHRDRVAFVAEVSGHIVGVGRFERIASSGSAEVAFVVADEHQARGVGMVLLEQLAAVARGLRVNRFEAEVLAHNRRMLGVFRDAGFAETERMDHGAVKVEMIIEPTERLRAAIEAREHRAESRSVARMLEARSVAVVGAGRRPVSLGHRVVVNLIGGFGGAVYPVNPNAVNVAGVLAYPSVGDVPDHVDLAVIAVPARAVVDVVGECGVAGVGSVVVLTAELEEVNPERAALESVLREVARDAGVRLVGPDSVGIVKPATGLNATFSPWLPGVGGVAMGSQAGAPGIVLLEATSRLELGVSSFVSVGRRADISGNDLLQYWEDDPATRVILLYLESFGNPRKFARIARRVSRRKPIVVVKAGRSDSEAEVDALFRQAGVVRVDTVDELFDTAALLDRQQLPTGRRVAIVGNAGGAGVLAADACVGARLELAALRPVTQTAIGAVAGPRAAAVNPVELGPMATPATFETAIAALVADPGVDAVLVVCMATLAAPPVETAVALGRAMDGVDTPVVPCLLAWPEPVTTMLGGGHAFVSPERSVRALARIADYADWRHRDPGVVPDLDGVRVGDAWAVVKSVLAERPAGRWLRAEEVERLLDAYAVPCLPYRVARSAEAAVDAATEVGYPVVIKIAARGFGHRSDVGAVRLDLRTPDDVHAAYLDMLARLGETATEVVVQPLVAAGVEVVVGLIHDPSFGPLVMVGMGGSAAELLDDRSFRLLPVTDVDAAELVRSLRTSPLLFGYRTHPPVDVASLENVVLRVAQLASDLPQVAEVELDPVMVTAEGSVAFDARVRVEPLSGSPTLEVRQLNHR